MDSKDETTNKRAKQKVDTHQPYGKVLEQLMKIHRWSGADLAREVGCTRNHISEILSGKCFPSFSLGQRIASVFGYELAWRKIPAVPKSPRKKKEPVFVAKEEIQLSPVAPEVTVPVAESNHSGNGASKEKIQKLKDLQEKTASAKKADEE